MPNIPALIGVTVYLAIVIVAVATPVLGLAALIKYLLS